MRGLGRRIPTALAYGAIVLAALVLPSPAFPILVATLAALAYRELAGLYVGRPGAPAKWPGTILVVGLAVAHLATGVSSSFALQLSVALVAAVALTLPAGYAVVRWIVPAAGPVLGSIAFTYLGAIYLGWLFGFLIDLWMAGSMIGALQPVGVLAARRELPWELHAWLLLALVPTWAADVGSYAVGSAIGRRKLAPRLSPGKTWEGTIAGFVAAALAVAALGALTGLPPVALVIAAVAIGPAALAGDLLGSALKRRVGAKDSGELLPGHGGVLDRIDSLVTVAPVVTIALYAAAGLG